MGEAKAAADDAMSELKLPVDAIVQEFGYDDDVDFDLRDRIEDLIGSQMATSSTRWSTLRRSSTPAEPSGSSRPSPVATAMSAPRTSSPRAPRPDCTPPRVQA